MHVGSQTNPYDMYGVGSLYKTIQYCPKMHKPNTFVGPTYFFTLDLFFCLRRNPPHFFGQPRRLLPNAHRDQNRMSGVVTWLGVEM